MTVGLIATISLVIVAFYFLTRSAPSEPTQAELFPGWNTVTYYGIEQTGDKALASIRDYFVIGYHWDEVQLWKQIMKDTILIPGEQYKIKVSEQCTWIF